MQRSNPFLLFNPPGGENLALRQKFAYEEIKGWSAGRLKLSAAETTL
jgi:hypothetical protein